MSNFKFSIIVAVYNSSKYLDETISSVINQDIGFEDNVQLILVNDGSTDNSMEIMQKYQSDFPNNIIALSKDNGGSASARNLGLKYATGEFINFLENGDKLSKNCLNNVYDFASKHENINIISIPIEYFGGEEGDHYLNYKFEDENICDLNKNFDYAQTNLCSCFIRLSEIDIELTDDLSNDVLFINSLLLTNLNYGLVKDSIYYSRHSFNLSNPKITKKDYFRKLETSKQLIENSIDRYGKVLKFIQFVILLDLKEILMFEGFSKEFNSANERNKLQDMLYSVLVNLDDKIILKHKALFRSLKYFLLYLKYDDFHVENKSKKQVVFKIKKRTMNRLNNMTLRMDIIELKKDVLCVSGIYSTVCYDNCVDIQLIKENENGEKEIFKPKYVEYDKRENKVFLGINWMNNKSFDFKVPVDVNNFNRIYFKIIYDENGCHREFNAIVRFNKFANLSQFSKYAVKNNNIITFKDNNLFVMPYSYKKMVKSELIDLKDILSERDSKFLLAIFYRLIHLILYPFMRNKRIWLYEDRLTVADDNAEHLFRYSLNQEDDISHYYVIEKNTPDYKRMLKTSKNVLAFGSIKHKIMYLFSEKIMSSHVDHSVLNPFFHDNLKYLNGKFTIQRCFLQHGIVKNDLSYWIKKCNINLYLFVTSAQLEYNSLFEQKYNYDKDVVHIFGLPRYDNLKSTHTKKQILFMPTWRNYARSRELFHNSKNFSRINSFINNPKLLSFAKENGYTIVFKPHFEIFEHIDLFDIPDEIKISANESYQKLFNESEMLITDFSSVSFDFGYLKKPILFYQEELDHHNPSTYFDEETMGFGEVIHTEDELVDKIIEYIKSGCEMEEKYKRRVDKFYKYNDKNNCKRTYNWLLENY